MGIFNRFPSFTQLYRNAGATLVRFPYTLVSAIVAAALGVAWVENNAGIDNFAGRHLLITAMLGVPLFTALSVYAERKQWSAYARRLFPVIGIVLLAAYYLSLPDNIDHPLMTMIRFLLLGLACHFLVAFMPFLGKDQQVGFWQFNKTLFLRFLLAVLYSAVVYTGLSIALLAADKLFGVDVDPDTYLELFYIVSAVFNTWLFLSWIPTDLDALNRSESYPNGLKVFTQFILLPLVVLYFVILIAYEVKIIVTWNWPRGWVSNLILWYSVVGILSLLLLHPLQRIAESRWIAAFGRWYFRGSIPLVILLFFAIFERVGTYGITVNRYLVIGMATGLAIVVLYFVFSRARDIRLIPIVLFVLTLLSAYGPWSAFSISEASQHGRLENFLKSTGILTNGRVQMASSSISLDNRREMSSIIRYLDEWHGIDAFSDWFDDSTLSAWQDIKTYGAISDSVASHLGFALVSRWQAAGEQGNFYFSIDQTKVPPVALHGFDYMYQLDYNTVTDSVFAFPFQGDSCFVRVFPRQATVAIRLRAATGGDSPGVSLDLTPHLDSIQQLAGNPAIDPDRLMFDVASNRIAARFLISRISGNKTDSSYSIELMSARVLVGRK